MTDAYQTLIGLPLPAGILEYFDLVKVNQGKEGLHLFLEEKNLPSSGYEKHALESKGFLPEVNIGDFSIRSQELLLQVKRRRWEVKAGGQLISRDWDVVRKERGSQQSSQLFYCTEMKISL